MWRGWTVDSFLYFSVWLLDWLWVGKCRFTGGFEGCWVGHVSPQLVWVYAFVEFLLELALGFPLLVYNLCLVFVQLGLLPHLGQSLGYGVHSGMPVLAVQLGPCPVLVPLGCGMLIRG